MKLSLTQQAAIYFLERDGSYCPGNETDAKRVMVRKVLDSLVKKRLVAVESTDDGPRYSLIPGALS